MGAQDVIVNIDNMPSYKEKQVTIMETEIPSSKTSATVSRPIRPRMHRRGTTNTIRAAFTDDNLTHIGRALYKLLENPIIRYCIYILPIGGLLAIPLVLFATKYRHKRADGIDLLGLFIWIEIVWVFLWIAKLIASALPYLFQGVCGLISTGVRKYALVLKAVEVPLSLFIWVIMALLWLPIIHVFNPETYHNHYSLSSNKENIHWLHILRNVIRGTIGSSALWLALKILMQLISVSYHGKQYKDKIKDIKMTSHAVDLLYNASLKRYHDHHPDFAEEDYDIHDSTNVQKLLKQYSADRTTMRIFGDIHYYGEKLVSIFGRMASDVTGTHVFRPTETHSMVEQALERKAGAEALARRIFRSLVQPGNDVIYEQDIINELGVDSESEAAFIFAQLDRDNNGDVSLDEMIMLVTGISRTRKDMWKSACDIKEAIKVLDHVLSVIVLAVIVLIYSAFFSNFLAANWSKILGVLSAGAFSFGTTVGEFNAACILVFVKHPYDVGDRVNINLTQYQVVRISLLYTVFRNVDTDAIVQVANQVVGATWIDNVSRSQAMKERLTFSVCAGTKFADIELLRTELENFVRAPENSRDFQPDVEIQLLSVGDLKQLDLRVEIRHKSNWSNETLRSYRRSKFMCALLSAMRKVPIDGPVGPGPYPGMAANPNYAVTISDEQAKAAKAKWDHDRAVTKSKAATEIHDETGWGSGLEILPSHKSASMLENLGAMRRPSFAVAQAM